MAFYFIHTNIRRYFMKYEVPVCDIIELCVEDVITTSVPVTSGEKAPVGDTVVVPVQSDNGTSGAASN